MNPETQAMLVIVAYVVVGILATIVSLLLTYFVIRQGVFHGLRAHTRWVDDGKDLRR